MEMMIAIKLKWCPWSCNLSPDYVSSLTLHSTGAKSEIASVILPSHFHLWHHLLLNVALLAGMPWQPSSGLQSGILQLKCLDIRDQGRRDMGGSSPAKPTPAKSQRMMVPKKNACHSTRYRFDMIAFTCFQLRTGSIGKQGHKMQQVGFMHRSRCHLKRLTFHDPSMIHRVAM